MGKRVVLSSRVLALTDVGWGWLFAMPAKYNHHVAVASAGPGFDLFQAPAAQGPGLVLPAP